MLSASGLPLDPDEKLRQGLRMIEMAYEERTRNADQELHAALRATASTEAFYIDPPMEPAIRWGSQLR